MIPPPPRRERTGSTPVADDAPASPTTSARDVKAKKTKSELERDGNAFVIEGALFGEPPAQVLVVPNEQVDLVKKAVEKEQDLGERRSRAASRASGKMQRGVVDTSPSRDEDSSTPKEREVAQAKKRTSAVRTSRIESGVKGRRTGTIPHKKKDAVPAAKDKAAKPASPSKKRQSRGSLLGLPKVTGWQRFKTASTATPTIASSTAGADDDDQTTETETAVKKDKGKARARSSRSASEAGDLGVVADSEAGDGQPKSRKDETAAADEDEDDDDDAFVTDVEEDPAAAESTPAATAEKADADESVQADTSYGGQLMALVGGVGSGLFAWVSSPQNGDERVSSSPVVPLIEVTESKAHDVESLTGETVKSVDPAVEGDAEVQPAKEDGAEVPAAVAASTSAAADDAETSSSDSESEGSSSASEESDKPPSYKAAAASKKRSRGADVVEVAPTTSRSKSASGVQRRDSKLKSRAVPSRKMSARRHSRQDSKSSTTKAARPKSGGLLNWDKPLSRRERMSRSDSTPAAIGVVNEENEDAARPAVDPAKKRFSLAFWGRTNSSPAVVKEVKEPKGPNRFSVVLTNTGNAVKGGGTKAGTAVKAGGTRAGTAVKAGGARAGLAVRQNSTRAGDAIKAGGDSVGRVSMRGLLSFMNVSASPFRTRLGLLTTPSSSPIPWPGLKSRHRPKTTPLAGGLSPSRTTRLPVRPRSRSNVPCSLVASP